jgi:precorrin-6B methylase 2
MAVDGDAAYYPGHDKTSGYGQPIMSKTDRAWKKWGEADPYYGVLSNPEYRGKNLTADSLSRFFASGEEHIDKVFSSIRSRIAADFSPNLAVDYGCGTGRLVIPLARRCREVIGIDIARAMLVETERNCSSLGLANVRVLEPAQALKGLTGVDLAHSYIVLQHIRPAIGMKIVADLVAALAPEGCIALHVTYERSVGPLHKFANWMRHHIPGAHTAFQLAQGRPISDAPMQMNQYPLNKLLQFLQENGFRQLHLEFTDHGGFLGLMIYGQLQRKSAVI